MDEWPLFRNFSGTKKGPPFLSSVFRPSAARGNPQNPVTAPIVHHAQRAQGQGVKRKFFPEMALSLVRVRALPEKFLRKAENFLPEKALPLRCANAPTRRKNFRGPLTQALRVIDWSAVTGGDSPRRTSLKTKAGAAGLIPDSRAWPPSSPPPWSCPRPARGGIQAVPIKIPITSALSRLPWFYPLNTAMEPDPSPVYLLWAALLPYEIWLSGRRLSPYSAPAFLDGAHSVGLNRRLSRTA